MAINIGALPLNTPMVYAYTYDQLNRLVAMDAYTGTNTGANLWSSTFSVTTGYQERIAYDANGNILKYKRNGAASSPNMDSMTYRYYAGTNQLSHIRESMPAGNYSDFAAFPRNIIDIDSQRVNNYLYDQIGNLIRDSSEAIRLSLGGIKWNVYGKIIEINKVDSGTNAFNFGRIKKISYTYDAAGNRISSKTEKYGTTAVSWTFYVRDASGNVMSVYSYTDSLRLAEQHIYGSSRLGIITPGINLERTLPSPVSMPILNGSGIVGTFIRGNKFFELSNHLGNVLVTLSDKKKAIQSGTSGTVWYYLPIVKSAQDYYPFGMVMPGRKFTSTTNYRYGFNGKEEDDEVKGDGNQIAYENRIYDPRLGRWFSLDPLQKKFPFESNYSFVSNNPIIYLDFDGRVKIITHIYIDQKTGEKLIVKVPVSNDLKSVPIRVRNNIDQHDWHWKYEWHDIEQTVTHVMSNGVEVKKVIGAETLGNVRVTTDVDWKWWAKMKAKTYEGGIVFTSVKGGGQEDKLAVIPVDVINIDALLDAFAVSGYASNTKNFFDMIKMYGNAKSASEKMKAVDELKKIIETTAKVYEKVKEKLPPTAPLTPDNKETKKYAPNSTFCLFCEGSPHGLTDGITDSEGNIKDTIKTEFFIKYNPKTKRYESNTKRDTIPTKPKD